MQSTNNVEFTESPKNDSQVKRKDLIINYFNFKLWINFDLSF